MNRKKILGAVLGAAFLVSASASAATITAETLKALGFTDAQIAVLLPMLNNSSATTATTSTTSVEKTFVYKRLLKIGVRGNDVAALQSCLNRLGNNTGVVDGIFGRHTATGVKSFQRAHGLVADGIVGPKTGPVFEEACAIKTTTSTGTTTTTTTTTTNEQKLEVSGKAADDLIVGKNQKVVFSTITIKAGDEDVDVKNIEVKYDGTADSDAIDKVLLLDDALLKKDDDTLNSDDEAKLEVDQKVKAGKTLTLNIAAITANDLSAYNGLDGTLTVTKITSDKGDIEGTPIKGAHHEFNNNAVIGEFNLDDQIEKTGTARIGETIKVATINVENKDEDDDAEIVKSFRLRRDGTADDSDIKNIRVKVAGKTYDAVLDEDDDDYYKVSFGDGIKLPERGDDEDFVVYATIEDGEGETFGLGVDDVVVLDNDGVVLVDNTPTGNGTSDWSYATYDSTHNTWNNVVTIEASDVVFHKTDDVAGHKVSADEKGADLASFDVKVTGSDVEGDLYVTVKASGADVEGTNAKYDPSDLDLDNVAIYTKDGDLVSDKEDTSFRTDSNSDDVVTYTIKFDDVDFDSAERAKDYIIKGDISKDAPDGTKYEITKIEYKSIEDEDGNDIADIALDISSPATIEVEATDLDATINDADDKDVNPDTDEVELAKIKLDATNSGDDVVVTKLKLKFVVKDKSGNTASTDVNATVDDVTNCEIFDGSNSLTSQEDPTQDGSVAWDDTDKIGTSTSTDTTFDLDDLVVKKDTEKQLSLRCDLGPEFEKDDTIKVIGVSFEAKGQVTDNDVDGDLTSDTTLTVTDGTLEVTKSSDDINDDKVVKENTDDVVLGEYKIKAKDRELKLDDVTVKINDNSAIDGKLDIYINGSKEDSVNATSDSVAEVTKVKFSSDDNDDDATTVKFDNTTVNIADGASAQDVATAIAGATYADYTAEVDSSADDTVVFTAKVAGDKDDIVAGDFEITGDDAKVESVTVDAQGADAEYKFENLDKTIDKDTTAVVDFKADVKDVDANKEIQITEVDATTVENKDASGNAVVYSTSDNGPVVTVVEAIPVVTQVNTNTSDLQSDDDVVLFTYKVKADGGDVKMAHTVFEVAKTNATLNNVKVRVYDNGDQKGSKKFEQTFTSNDKDSSEKFDTDFSDLQVDENDTYYVFLIADVRVSDDIRSIDVKVADHAYDATAKTGFDFSQPDIDGDKLIEDDMKALLKKD